MRHHDIDSNLIEIQLSFSEEYKGEMNDYTLEMSAQALFEWLTWLMYYR